MGKKSKKIEAIDKVVHQYSSLIRSAIRKTSPQIDESQMDDIEQEVKIKIWKEILKSEKKIHNLGSYIWKVTYTTTCRIMKTLSTEKKITWDTSDKSRNHAENLLPDNEPSPNHLLEKKEMVSIIKEAIDSLIESRRAVLKLYLMGMDQLEISEFFGWSEDKVRNLVSRGLADLKKVIQKRGL